MYSSRHGECFHIAIILGKSKELFLGVTHIQGNETLVTLPYGQGVATSTGLSAALFVLKHVSSVKC